MIKKLKLNDKNHFIGDKCIYVVKHDDVYRFKLQGKFNNRDVAYLYSDGNKFLAFDNETSLKEYLKKEGKE